MLRSTRFVLLASLILPPAGLVLLWLRSGDRLGRKILGSALIACWGVAYLALFFGLRFPLDGSGLRPIPTFKNREAHYAELERNRAGQGIAAYVETAQPSADPVKQESAARAEVRPGSAYWTDFRGPQRDGRYDQSPVRAQWPASGLPLVWRQPVGGGYASFVIVNGRAFTIEEPDIDEIAREGERPADFAQRMADEKAAEVAARCRDAWIVAADTVVALDTTALGKPRDAVEAVAMLMALAGRAHTVFTGTGSCARQQSRRFSRTFLVALSTPSAVTPCPTRRGCCAFRAR